MSEAELLKLLGVSKSTLASMRVAGLPCLYMTTRCRLYIDREVLEWAAGHRKPKGPKTPKVSAQPHIAGM